MTSAQHFKYLTFVENVSKEKQNPILGLKFLKLSNIVVNNEFEYLSDDAIKLSNFSLIDMKRAELYLLEKELPKLYKLSKNFESTALSNNHLNYFNSYNSRTFEAEKSIRPQWSGKHPIVYKVEKRIQQLLKEIKDDELILNELKLKPRKLSTVEDVNLAYEALTKEENVIRVKIDKLFDYYESKLIDFSNLVLTLKFPENPVFSDCGRFLTEDIVNSIKSLNTSLEKKKQAGGRVKNFKNLVDKVNSLSFSEKINNQETDFESGDYYEDYETLVKDFNESSFDVKNKVELLSEKISRWLVFSTQNSVSLDRLSKKPVLPKWEEISKVSSQLHKALENRSEIQRGLSNLSRLSHYYADFKLKKNNNEADNANINEKPALAYVPDFYKGGQFVVITADDAIQKKKLLEIEFLEYDNRLKDLVDKFRSIAVRRKSFVNGVGLKVDLIDKSDIELMFRYFNEKSAVHELKLKNLDKQKFLTKVIDAYSNPVTSMSFEDAKILLNELEVENRQLEVRMNDITNKTLKFYKNYDGFFNTSKKLFDPNYKLLLDYLDNKSEIIEKKKTISKKMFFVKEFLKGYKASDDSYNILDSKEKSTISKRGDGSEPSDFNDLCDPDVKLTNIVKTCHNKSETLTKTKNIDHIKDELFDFTNSSKPVKEAILKGLDKPVEGASEFYIINDDLFSNGTKLQKFISIITDKFEKEIITKDEMQKILKIILLKNMINIEKESTFWSLLVNKVENMYDKKVWTNAVIRQVAAEDDQPKIFGLKQNSSVVEGRKCEKIINQKKSVLFKKKFSKMVDKVNLIWFESKNWVRGLYKPQPQQSGDFINGKTTVQEELNRIHEVSELFYLIKNKVSCKEKETGTNKVNGLMCDSIKNYDNCENGIKNVKNIIKKGLTSVNNGFKPTLRNNDMFSKQEFIDIIKKNSDIYNFYRKNSDIQYFKDLKDHITIEEDKKSNTILKKLLFPFNFFKLASTKFANWFGSIKERVLSFKAFVSFSKMLNTKIFKKSNENCEIKCDIKNNYGFAVQEKDEKKEFKYQKYDVFTSNWDAYRRKLVLRPVFFIVSKTVELWYNACLWFKQLTFKYSFIIYTFIILFSFCALVLIINFYLLSRLDFLWLLTLFNNLLLLLLYLLSQCSTAHLIAWCFLQVYIIYRVIKWMFKRN